MSQSTETVRDTFPTVANVESVDFPHLAIDFDDIRECETCGDLNDTEYARRKEYRGDCPECRGYRLVHGYSTSGRGRPGWPSCGCFSSNPRRAGRGLAWRSYIAWSRCRMVR